MATRISTPFTLPITALCLGIFALSGCGVTGATGEAMFTVGSSWSPDTPIAVGSRFGVSAVSNDLAKTKLRIESRDNNVFSLVSGSSDGTFEAKGPGTADFAALDSAGKEIDHLAYSAAAASQLELSNWAERIVAAGAVMPETLSLVAGTKLSIRAELLGAQGQSLNHAGLVTSAPGNSSMLAVTSAHGVDHELIAKGLGATSVDFAAGTLARKLTIQVVDPSAVADFALAYAPLMVDLGSIDKTNPSAAPADSEKAPTSQVYFAKIRAKDSNGGAVYGAAGKWSVAVGQVQLVNFAQGVSEAQYFELAPGQKATLSVELAGKTKELAIVGQ
jgi:hypothetical protein